MPKPSRGGRGGGGRGSGREVAISKALSYALRHAAEREGLKIDSQGYVNVADVLAWRKLRSLKVSFAEIVSAVETSDKKRFALLYAPQSETSASSTEEAEAEAEAEAEQEATAATATATAKALTASTTDQNANNYLIRATQGHSIKSVEAEALLERLSLNDPEKLPETVVHGTYHSVWPMILESGGLRCMGRNHAHFATGPAIDSVLGAIGEGSSTGDGVISGMRGDAQVLIYINLRKALEGGCPFWRSENGVILSEGMSVSGKEGGESTKVIPVDFFDVVVERRKGLGKIWEAGEVLQTLPKELTSRRNPKGR